MNDERRELLPLESTGNVALDQILGGGIPARSILVVAGEPGSGKTVLTLQIMFHAARQGKKCLYFTTMSEPAMKLIRYMQLFEFFDLEVMEESITFVDLGAPMRAGAGATLSAIAAHVEEVEPAFVAIDSFRAIGEIIGVETRMRPFVYELAVQMAAWGATTLLIGEYTREEYDSFAEFGIADGILRLGSEQHELTSVRELEVLKLRGAAYKSGKHFFDINARGVAVYPRVSAPLEARTRWSAAPDERVSSGVAGIDALLHGGLPRASTTIVQGGTGTGKTLLGLQFLVEGARRGEKGILFGLEETPDQLRAVGRTMGWELEALEQGGLMVFHYCSPVELSTDRYLYDARTLVGELGATRAVFDSLTTMSLGVRSERRFKEMVYAISKHMHGAGVSLLMNVETPQLLGSATLSGHGVSFIADNLVQLRYVELDGRLERAISVLKARGIAHESELRALVIKPGGFEIVEGRFKDMRGVLTGLPARDPRDPS